MTRRARPHSSGDPAPVRAGPDRGVPGATGRRDPVANRRALAFLEYKLRAIRPIDNLLRQTMDRLIANPDIDVAPVFPPDTLMGGARLAQPRKEVPRLAPTPLRQVIISDRTRAIGNLVRRAQERRSITPMKLRAYAEKVLQETAAAGSDALPCGSIEDLRAFQVLTSVAMATNSADPFRLEMEGRASAPGMGAALHQRRSRRAPVLERQAIHTELA